MLVANSEVNFYICGTHMDVLTVEHQCISKMRKKLQFVYNKKRYLQLLFPLSSSTHFIFIFSQIFFLLLLWEKEIKERKHKKEEHYMKENVNYLDTFLFLYIFSE